MAFPLNDTWPYHPSIPLSSGRHKPTTPQEFLQKPGHSRKAEPAPLKPVNRVAQDTYTRHYTFVVGSHYQSRSLPAKFPDEHESGHSLPQY